VTVAPEPAARDGVPEAAERRLRSGAWSSGLSVADFATCLQMGMDPVGFVQGYAVMQWSWTTNRFGPSAAWGGFTVPGGGYQENYYCPHGYVSPDHRAYGMNVEQRWVEDAWNQGWWLAFDRMMDEARQLGAHGVIGVVDDRHPLAGTGTQEFSARGTAVVVPGADPPAEPFSTLLAGQRLAKLIEAGFAPVSVVAAASSVAMLGNCITTYQLSGTSTGWFAGAGAVTEIAQVGRAQWAVRNLAREQARGQLHGDTLHGTSMDVFEREMGEGSLAIQCVIRGNRVRRFKDFSPLPAPAPVVRLT